MKAYDKGEKQVILSPSHCGSAAQSHANWRGIYLINWASFGKAAEIDVLVVFGKSK